MVSVRPRVQRQEQQQQMLRKIYLPRIFMDFWVKEAPSETDSQLLNGFFTPTEVGQTFEITAQVAA